MVPSSSLFHVLLLVCASGYLPAAVGYLPNFPPPALMQWRVKQPPAESSSSLSSSSSSSSSSTTNNDKKNSVPGVDTVYEMPDPIPLQDELNHRYYLLRHGQSTANVANIISSSRSLAYTEKHGLTPFGCEQSKASAKQIIDLLQGNDNEDSTRFQAKSGDQLVFVSSPFARAKQTAENCHEELTKNENLKSTLDSMGVHLHPTIHIHDSLVERFFGRLDDQAIYTYAYVWPLDMFNVTHTAFDVESVAAVCKRISKVVSDMEKSPPWDTTPTTLDDEEITTASAGTKSSTTHVVLVSHADVLQIAQLYAARADNVGTFSSYRFKNCEVRRMIMGETSQLPEPVPLQPPQRMQQS